MVTASFIPSFYLLLVFVVIGTVCGEQIKIKRSLSCSGVYSKEDASGTLDPLVSVALNPARSHGSIGVLIFNILDEHALSLDLLNGDIDHLFCTDSLIGKGLCQIHQRHQLLKAPLKTLYSYHVAVINATKAGPDTILNETLPVKSTGFYCVILNKLEPSSTIKGVLHFCNPYGFLPARNYPPMLLNMFLTLAYLIFGIIWLYHCRRYKKEILAIQRYITWLTGALMLECLVTFSYFVQYNRAGVSSSAIEFVYLITSCCRSTVSLFLLLTVSMGYGIWKPHLGRTKYKIYILSIFHLVFGFASSYAELYSYDKDNDTFFLLVTFPFAVMNAIFFIWIVYSLSKTMDVLKKKGQTVKLGMYHSLTRLMYLFFTFAVFFIFSTAATLVSHRSDLSWRGKHWQEIWFWVDGWPAILYFCCFIFTTWLFRPRKDNRRYGLEQIPTDAPLDAIFGRDDEYGIFDDLHPGHGAHRTFKDAEENDIGIVPYDLSPMISIDHDLHSAASLDMDRISKSKPSSPRYASDNSPQQPSQNTNPLSNAPTAYTRQVLYTMPDPVSPSPPLQHNYDIPPIPTSADEMEDWNEEHVRLAPSHSKTS
jgi:hypothetical protein